MSSFRLPSRRPPATEQQVAVEEAPARPQGKGRPTPKRSAARGPVAPPPQSRKEAAARMRERQSQDRKTFRSGERLLPRDQGPARAAVRDVVDGRRNLATLLLPVALLYVLASVVSGVTGSATPLDVMQRVFQIAVLLLLADSVVLVLALRSRLREIEGERTRRHAGYALLRSSALRRFRMPPPQVRPAPLLPGR